MINNEENNLNGIEMPKLVESEMIYPNEINEAPVYNEPVAPIYNEEPVRPIEPVVPVEPVIAPVVETPVIPVEPVIAPVVETPVVPVEPVIAPVIETPVVPVEPVIAPVIETPVEPTKEQQVQEPEKKDDYKPSKLSTIIGTMILLLITFVLVMWIIKNYLVI